MKAALLHLLLVIAITTASDGHIGSPNVVFAYQTVPYEVGVVIRPPATLPGIARIDVRITNADISRVELRAHFLGAGLQAAPAAVPTASSPRDRQLFSGEVWLLRSGAHEIEVSVDGTKGRGLIHVPFDSAVTQAPIIPAGLGIFLGMGVVVLGLAAIVIARSMARDAGHHAGAKPTVAKGHAIPIVTVASTLGVCSALAAGAFRWQTLDRRFRSHALSQPVPVAAAVRTSGSLPLVRITRLPGPAPGRDWRQLVTDHGKLIHLFLVLESDQSAFAHLHPVRRDANTLEGVLPPLPSGTYQLYGELTYRSGSTETVVSQLTVPEPAGVPSPQKPFDMETEVWCRSGESLPGDAPEPVAMDVDDSWNIARSEARFSRVSQLADGSRMVFENAAELVENEEVLLRFAVFSASGDSVALQTYMGMRGHTVIRRSGGDVFAHLHPVGTISMAAQQIAAEDRKDGGLATSQPPAGRNTPPTAREVTFPYAFPKDGEYRIWVQARVEGGHIVTGVFDVQVKPARQFRTR